MKINDNRIQFLFAAWRAGSMRAAAESMDVAPSSISRQIAQLEAETGTPLIEHGQREIRLTDAGHAVIDYFRARQSSMELLEGQLQDLSASRSGHVSITLGEGFLGPALDRILEEFMDSYPGITMGIDVTDTTRMVSRLLEDDVHFGVGFHPVAHPQIVSRFRATAPLEAIMTPDHPLAGRAALTMPEICAQPLALMGSSFRIRQIIDEAASESGTLVSPLFTSNSITQLARFTISGRAMTILPAFSVGAPLAEGRLVRVAIEASYLRSVYVHLLSRRGRRFPPHVMRLAEQIRRQLMPAAIAAR